MHRKSVYCVECICGYRIESETKTLICPGCQRLVVIEWRVCEEEDHGSEPLEASAAA